MGGLFFNKWHKDLAATRGLGQSPAECKPHCRSGAERPQLAVRVLSHPAGAQGPKSPRSRLVETEGLAEAEGPSLRPPVSFPKWLQGLAARML